MTSVSLLIYLHFDKSLTVFALWWNSYHSNSNLQVGRIMLVGDIAQFTLSSSRSSSAVWISQSRCTVSDTLKDQSRCEEFLSFALLLFPLFQIVPHVISWNIKQRKILRLQTTVLQRLHSTLIIFFLIVCFFIATLLTKICYILFKNVESLVRIAYFPLCYFVLVACWMTWRITTTALLQIWLKTQIWTTLNLVIRSKLNFVWSTFLFFY